jgi:hypothetical protein
MEEISKYLSKDEVVRMRRAGAISSKNQEQYLKAAKPKITTINIHDFSGYPPKTINPKPILASDVIIIDETNERHLFNDDTSEPIGFPKAIKLLNPCKIIVKTTAYPAESGMHHEHQGRLLNTFFKRFTPIKYSLVFQPQSRLGAAEYIANEIAWIAYSMFAPSTYKLVHKAEITAEQLNIPPLPDVIRVPERIFAAVKQSLEVSLGFIDTPIIQKRMKQIISLLQPYSEKEDSDSH